MKTMTHTNAAAENAAASHPVKVCMLFIENPARNEPRLMRDGTALAQAGFEVTIIDVEQERSRPVEEELQGVHLKHIISPTWYVNTRFKPWFLVKLIDMYLRCIVRLLQTPADIYHVHVEKAFLPAYIVARLRRKPLIFDLPDLPFWDPYLTRWSRLTALSSGLLARLIPYCSRIITASPLYAQEISKHYPEPEITLIRNVPTYRALAKSDRLHRYLGLDADVRIALYQGAVKPDRELHRLVLAARYLEPETVIVILGPSFRGVAEQLEELSKKEGVADRVKILPPVHYDELLDWTASADIGLPFFTPTHSLNTRYTLPNKLFEYLMAGLPVVSFELDAIADVIRTYDVGRVVSSLEPSAFAEGINQLLADREALARMRQNALEIAREEFNWEKESRRLLHLYQEVLAVPDRKGSEKR